MLVCSAPPPARTPSVVASTPSVASGAAMTGVARVATGTAPLSAEMAIRRRRSMSMVRLRVESDKTVQFAGQEMCIAAIQNGRGSPRLTAQACRNGNGGTVALYNGSEIADGCADGDAGPGAGFTTGGLMKARPSWLSSRHITLQWRDVPCSAASRSLNRSGILSGVSTRRGRRRPKRRSECIADAENPRRDRSARGISTTGGGLFVFVVHENARRPTNTSKAHRVGEDL